MQVDVKAVELRFDDVALKIDVKQNIQDLANEVGDIDVQVKENSKTLVTKADKSEVRERNEDLALFV